MEVWTVEVIADFEIWLNRQGGGIELPVKELFSGAFEIKVIPPEGMTGQEAVDRYDKEVLKA